MPIKGLSEKTILPRLGKVHLGIKVNAKCPKCGWEGLADEDAPRVSLIRGQMRGYYDRKVRGNRSGKSSLRLAIILIILSIIAYYLLYY